MGCTNDVINMKCKKKEDISTFMDMFNQLLYEDLYYGKYDLEDIEIEKEEECYHIFFEDEPMFRRAEGGNIIENFVKAFITKNPTIHFSLDYFCSYTNCGAKNTLEIYKREYELKLE